MNIQLGVNIDHIATLRQARGESYPDTFEAASGAPSMKWRMAIRSAKQLTVLAVSCTDSPLAVEELAASEKPKTLPPSSIMAAVKLKRVRVLGS